MWDKQTLRQRVRLRILASWSTLLPFVAGATGLATALFFRYPSSAFVAFGSLAALVGSVGIVATRLLVGGEKITREEVAKLEAEAQKERVEAIEKLRRRLREDDDTRNDKLFGELLVKVEMIRKNQAAATLNAYSAFDILSGVDRLFHACEAKLLESVDLSDNAARLAPRSTAKKQVMDRRTAILDEVEESVGTLDRILASMGQMTTQTEAGEDLSKIRRELDENLDIARRVDEQMKNIGGDSSEKVSVGQ